MPRGASAPSAAWSCGRMDRCGAPTTTFTASRATSCSSKPAWRADAGPAVVIGAGGGARAVVYAPRRPRRARDPRGQSDACARRDTRARVRSSVTPIDWDDRHRALEGAAMLVNTTSQGMVGQPPLDLELARFRRAHWSPTSFIFRSKRRCWPRRATAATAPSTGSGCCFTRRASPGSSGSGSTPRSRRELRSTVEATLPHQPNVEADLGGPSNVEADL